MAVERLDDGFAVGGDFIGIDVRLRMCFFGMDLHDPQIAFRIKICKDTVFVVQLYERISAAYINYSKGEMIHENSVRCQRVRTVYQDRRFG